MGAQRTVTIYIDTDGETTYDAPDDITVTIVSRPGHHNATCVCGGTITTIEGVWGHREPADVHGRDHLAEPATE